MTANQGTHFRGIYGDLECKAISCFTSAHFIQVSLLNHLRISLLLRNPFTLPGKTSEFPEDSFRFCSFFITTVHAI